MGNRRGSRPRCWSSHSCTGSWRRSIRSHRGRHWRTGQRRSRRGRHTCSSPECCSRRQSHRQWGWSIHSHLSKESKRTLHRDAAGTRKMKGVVSKGLLAHRRDSFKNTLMIDIKAMRRANFTNVTPKHVFKCLKNTQNNPPLPLSPLFVLFLSMWAACGDSYLQFP